MNDLSEILERANLAYGRIAAIQGLCEQHVENSIDAKCEIRTAQEPGFPKTFRLTVTSNAPVPTQLKTEAGIVAHELRSTLDSLACALAWRNGQDPGENTYFPISKSQDIFETDGQRKMRKLSRTDQASIATLRPFKGGHPLLYPLHQADKMRKHQRLTAQANVAGSIDIGGAIRVSAGAQVTIRGGTMGGHRIGEIEVPARPHQLAIGVPVLVASGRGEPPPIAPDITLVWEEPAEVAGWAVVQSLYSFSDVVRDIVQSFE